MKAKLTFIREVSTFGMETYTIRAEIGNQECVFTQQSDAEAWLRERTAERIESERPADGVPIPTSSTLELAAYRMPNGSKFVTLIDETEETWEAYCAEVRARALAASRQSAQLASWGVHPRRRA